MTEGPIDNKLLDNYLSADEEAYFKSGGDETYEERLVADESNSEAAEDTSGDDSGAEPEPSDGADESDSEPDDAGETSSDESLESDDDEERSDSDEKSSKRDYEKAFKVERHKRKELKEALEATSKKTAEMEATLAKLQKAFVDQQVAQPAPAPAPQENVPDPEEDPLGYQQYQIKQLEKQIVQHNKYLNEKHEYEQRESQQNAFLRTYQQSAKQFADKNPDFKEAYKFLSQSRFEEYQASGYSADEADRLMMEDEMALVAKAYNDKVNPAERVYNLAKKRGYSAASASKKQVAPKNIKDLKKGMENSKSLRSGGGEMPDHELGIDDVDSMSFSEFEDFFNKFKAKSKRQG